MSTFIESNTHILLMVNMKHKAIPNYIYNPEWWNELGLLSSDHNGLEFQLSLESCVALSLSLGLSEQQFVVSGCSLWNPGKGVHHCKSVARLRDVVRKHPQEHRKVCAQ